MYALMCKHGYTQIDTCYCDGLAHSFIAFWPVDFITYNCNYFWYQDYWIGTSRDFNTISVINIVVHIYIKEEK